MTDSGSSVVSGWRPHLWDVVLAGVVTAAGLRILADAGGGVGFRKSDVLAYVLTAVGCAAVGWARRAPLAVLVVTGCASIFLVVRDNHVDILPFVITGVLFSVASYRPRREAVAGLVVVAIMLALSAATRPADLGVAALVQTAMIMTAAWGSGLLVRGRRTALLALVAEAEQRASAERELAAAELDQHRLAVVDERLRIARDVHDVLAHSMGIVSVQATVGAHLAADDPVAARQALLTISDVARSSMQDLRQMLTLLRDDSPAGIPDEESYRPARGLADLEQLLDSYRGAGLRVMSTTSGAPQDLSASADLCAYRIVQEALTNTLKHADADTADVLLEFGSDALTVIVDDDGRGYAPVSGGHGLTGMAERVGLLGGRLSAGPSLDGGFTVEATIPYYRDLAVVGR